MLNNWFVQIAEVTEHLSFTSEHEYFHSKIQHAEEFCLWLWYEWTESSPEKDISSIFNWACKTRNWYNTANKLPFEQWNFTVLFYD